MFEAAGALRMGLVLNRRQLLVVERFEHVETRGAAGRSDRGRTPAAIATIVKAISEPIGQREADALVGQRPG